MFCSSSSPDDLHWTNRPKCKYRNNESMRVTIPDATSLSYDVSRELGYSKKENAPCFVRNISGDFEVKIKISAFEKMKSLHDQAGLIIRQNNHTYMRFGLEMCTNNDDYNNISNAKNNSCSSSYHPPSKRRRSMSSSISSKKILPCIRPVIVRDGFVDKSTCIPLTKKEQDIDEHWFSIRCKNGILTAFSSSDGISYKATRKVRLGYYDSDNKTKSTGSNGNINSKKSSSNNSSSSTNEFLVGLYGANPLGIDDFQIIYEDFQINEIKPNYAKQQAKVPKIVSLNSYIHERPRRRNSVCSSSNKSSRKQKSICNSIGMYSLDEYIKKPNNANDFYQKSSSSLSSSGISKHAKIIRKKNKNDFIKWKKKTLLSIVAY